MAVALNDLGGQRNDLHELLLAQLARHRAEDTGAPWIVFLVDDDNGVVIEAEVGAIGAADRTLGANDDRVDDFTLFDLTVRGSFFDVGLDDITNAGIALVAPEDTNGRG